MAHRIDIEQAVELALVTITDDVTTDELVQQRDDLLAIIYAWHAEQKEEDVRTSAYLDGMRNAADEIGAFNTWQSPQVFAEHLRAIADSIEARKIREG